MLEERVLGQKADSSREGYILSGAKTKPGNPSSLLAKTAAKRNPCGDNYMINGFWSLDEVLSYSDSRGDSRIILYHSYCILSLKWVFLFIYLLIIYLFIHFIAQLQSSSLFSQFQPHKHPSLPPLLLREGDPWGGVPTYSSISSCSRIKHILSH